MKISRAEAMKKAQLQLLKAEQERRAVARQEAKISQTELDELKEQIDVLTGCLKVVLKYLDESEKENEELRQMSIERLKNLFSWKEEITKVGKDILDAFRSGEDPSDYADLVEMAVDLFDGRE